jgi:hypothetical protein
MLVEGRLEKNSAQLKEDICGERSALAVFLSEVEP